jgi:Uri superfamily endonuclease
LSTYLLITQQGAGQIYRVGALGEVYLEPGWYLYVGSARRHLAARLRRHLRVEKKRRWHIDYLLTGDALTIREIWVGEPGAECRLAMNLLSLPEITIPKPRLGASDCRCPAHFFRYDGDLATMRQHLLILGFFAFCPIQPGKHHTSTKVKYGMF